MAYNIIQIKRRLPGGNPGAPTFLSGGELAYNEVDSKLYYGSASGAIAIAGSGAYVNIASNQTITGNKTFTGSTVLSSTTWSAGSTLDFNGAVLTDIGSPTSNFDAATKKYVDDKFLSSNSTGSSAVTALSAKIYNNFVEKIESEAVKLNGGLTVTNGLTANLVKTTGNASVGGDLTVSGNLNVLGDLTQMNTTTTVTSAFSVTNTGTTTALTVTQTGSTDIAKFFDDAATALIIKNGGNVGIGTATPTAKLDVNGNIVTNGNITGDGASLLSDFVIDGGIY